MKYNFRQNKTGCEFSRKSSFSKLRTIQKQTNHLSFASWILAEERGHEIHELKKKKDEGWAVLFEATQRRQDELCVMWRNICIQIIPADVIICHETGHCPWTVPATPCRHVTCTCTLRNGRVSGGFFFAWKDFGRMFDNLFPACAFFFFFLSGD